MECGIGVIVDGSTGPVRTVATLAVPPRDAPAATSRRSGGRPTLSWQHFEDPSGHGAVQFSRVAWLGIGRVRAAAHRVVNDPRRLGNSSGSDVHIVLQVSGTSVLEQTGRMLTLEPGSWAAPQADHPYTMTSLERTERLILAIGRKHLSAELSTQWVGRAFSAASGTGRLFFSTAVCLADELPYIRISHARALADQLTALLHVALQYEISFGPVEQSDLRRERVHRYIAQHLRDPQLTVERIAADLGWPRRTLARVFASHGETLMEYVYHQRLEGVRRDLLNPILEARALADIARSWGFVNYTHFSDRFRTHFGVSPTTVRRRAIAARAVASQVG
ncbi:MAG: helix-turn-helix protein [Gammaproteobacteria bacterium]|nr:helix-turn-helix protein [Gammaproteobacteria bacterium]